ncbi:MAG: inorganic pyrophosphatase [Prolixibacteraceae bacterium]|jgi:inorganic pyrophosphatase|nr:inorganic pyrophosphatase [Prolixibacteraceae bacterium]
MTDKLSDPIGRLMGLRYKSHPWHGVSIGKNAPSEIIAFIEMVSTDTVKYEIDKENGYLKLDRPQKYSSLLPALYGFIPQTFCGARVGDYCSEKVGREGIIGDGDPIDIVVLTEKTITHGDILVDAKPIGGFRMIDGKEADDKIIAILRNDVVYGKYKDVSELPEIVVKRLKHYFLTYKDLPGTNMVAEIPDTYGATEAKEVIKLSMQDYSDRFDNLGALLYSK